MNRFFFLAVCLLAGCATAPPTNEALVAECVMDEIDRRTGWLSNDDGLLRIDAINAYCRSQYPPTRIHP